MGALKKIIDALNTPIGSSNNPDANDKRSNAKREKNLKLKVYLK